MSMLVPVEDCDVTYTLDTGEAALIYSRSDKFEYKCKQSFQTIDPRGNLTLSCQHFRLRFNCNFERMDVAVDDNTFQYCLDDLVPQHVGQVMSVTYDRQVLGFNGGFVCTLSASAPKSEPLRSLCKACGVSLAMETKTDDQQQDHRIVGGVTAEKGKHPWIAHLQIYPSPDTSREYRCGGSVVTDQLIVSAAHCFYGFDLSHVNVVLGLHDNRNPTSSVTIRAASIILHPNYDEWEIINDVALLRLEEPVQFSDSIRPICLPSAELDVEGKTVTAAGWGAFYFGGELAEELQEVEVQAWFQALCRDVWRDLNVDVISTQICALGDQKDTCSGDSGGPLMYWDGEKYILVGVTSFGYGCAHHKYPGVYTRVSSYVPWIEEHMTDDECQNDQSL